MALDYSSSAALMSNQPFKDRVKVACLKYATFIQNEAASVPAHSTRVRWAQQTVGSPEATAMTVTPPTVMDPAVQTADIDGTTGDSTITDAALQSAVEGTVNKLI